MKLTLKAISVCILTLLFLNGSAAAVFGGSGEGNIVQSEENLVTALSAAGLTGEEIDLKKADSYKVVFFADGFKYVYIFSGSGSNVVESHVICTGSCRNCGEEAYADFNEPENDFDGDKAQKAGEELLKSREKAEEERQKAAERAQKEAGKEAEKQAKEAEKAGKLRD